MKKKYHVSGLFNGGSAMFDPNPRGWIGKTICIELEEEDLPNIHQIYLDKVREKITFMMVTTAEDVKIEGECNCSLSEKECALN